MRLLAFALLLIPTLAQAGECNLQALSEAELHALALVMRGPFTGPIFFAHDDGYKRASDEYQDCLHAHGPERWTLEEIPAAPKQPLVAEATDPARK